MKNNKWNQIDSHKIKISINDPLEEKIKDFIKLIEIDYKDFKKDLKKEDEIWENILKGNLVTKNEQKNDSVKKSKSVKEKNKKRAHFTPEKVLIRSPITIIDAPWGTGKTYFIEEMGKMFLKGKEESFFFKKFVIIDTWKFCNSEDVIYEIIDELAKIFLDDEERKEENKVIAFISWIIEKIKLNVKSLSGTIEFSSNLMNQLSVSYNYSKFRGNKRENIEIDKIEREKEKISLVMENPPLTMIFFDNIERLGSYSWMIIKIIQKLSMINNLILIFPINKNKLHSLDYDGENENYEMNIEKYIQLPFYILEQDYLGVLEKIKINKDYINIVNDILIESIDGFNMSVRKVLKTFKHLNIKEKFDEGKHKGLISLKEIWDPIVEINKNKIDELIIEDIRGFSKYASFLNDWSLNLKNIIFKDSFLVAILRNEEYRNNLNKKWSEIMVKINEFYYVDGMYKWNNLNRNWEKEMKDIVSFLKEIYLYNKNKIEKINEQIINLNKDRKEKEEKKVETESGIEESNQIINKLKNSKIKKEIEKLSVQEHVVQKLENVLEEYKEDLKKMDFDIKLLNDEREGIKSLNSLKEKTLSIEINKCISIFLTENKKFMSENEMKNIWNFYQEIYDKKEYSGDLIINNEEFIIIVFEKIKNNHN